jgi:hypothetical protein
MKKLILMLATAGLLVQANAQNDNTTTPSQNQNGSQQGGTLPTTPSTSPNQGMQPAQGRSSQMNQSDQNNMQSQTIIESKQVPSSITTNFQSSYPSANNVQWMKVGENYQAVYYPTSASTDRDSYIIYTPTGTLYETGEGISASDFPSSATTYVKTKYKNGQLTRYYKVKDANGKTLYKGKTKDNGYLIFDSNGNFVKEERGSMRGN